MTPEQVVSLLSLIADMKLSLDAQTRRIAVLEAEVAGKAESA
jgi:hypothetical protein